MYNQYQQLAIDSTEDNVIIIAPPGSGKTHTMTGAIEKFLKENPINDGITAITFTNKAADELRERLGFNALSVHIATIHSWSYVELKKLSEKHSFRLRILDKRAIEDILLGLMPKHRVYPQYLNHVYSYVMGNVNPDLAIWIAQKYRAIRDEYVEYKRKMYLYDFTDYPLYLHDQLNKYNETITLEGIFVDEFQDVDPIQLLVFDRVEAKRKFFIGDPDQAIYQFRGATEDIFDKLPGYTHYTLYENYRSYQEIIDYSFMIKDNGYIPNGIKKLNRSDVVASRGFGGTIFHDNGFDFLRIDKDNIYPIDYMRVMPKLLSNHHFTVLCRTNREVNEVKKLGYYDAMTIHQAKGLEFQNVIVLNFEDRSEEDVNVRFVAHTRAKNILVCLDISKLERISANSGSPITKLF